MTGRKGLEEGRSQIPLRSCFLGMLCVYISLKFLRGTGELLLLALCCQDLHLYFPGHSPNSLAQFCLPGLLYKLYLLPSFF